MTRAVFLPFTGDPFILKKWLSCFARWEEEVDLLYILENATMSPEVARYCWNITKPLIHKDKIYYLHEQRLIDHGPALNVMLERCLEDSILLVEEDGFIFKKGQVDKCFTEIETGDCDLIASPRGSCPEELWKAENRAWPESPEQQPNFWPNFLFVKRSDLLRTDQHFAATQWKKGDFISQLSYTIKAEIVPSDTFVWASIQLRGMGLRIKLLEQYHAMVEDIEHKNMIAGVFDRKAPWIHIGSSSTWKSILFEKSIPKIHGKPEEWEPRAAMWLMCWEDAQEDLPAEMKTFSEQYKAGIDRLIKEYGLSEARVKYRVECYRNLLKG